jgi:hypothetical protein
MPEQAENAPARETTLYFYTNITLIILCIMPLSVSAPFRFCPFPD